MRLRTASGLFWMATQAVCIVVGVYAGWAMPNPPTSRPVWMIIGVGYGVFYGLTLTVIWVLLYELFRFTLPRLVRRGAKKVHRR